MNDAARTDARSALEALRTDAASLRLRVVALSLLAVVLGGGSIVVAFGALGTEALGAALVRVHVGGIHLPLVGFVCGLGSVIGAAVSFLRLATANERAGAAERLLEGRVRLRSSRARSAGSLTRVDLVFDDGHRADLELEANQVEAVLALIARATVSC